MSKEVIWESSIDDSEDSLYEFIEDNNVSVIGGEFLLAGIIESYSGKTHAYKFLSAARLDEALFEMRAADEDAHVAIVIDEEGIWQEMLHNNGINRTALYCLRAEYSKEDAETELFNSLGNRVKFFDTLNKVAVNAIEIVQISGRGDRSGMAAKAMYEWLTEGNKIWQM